MENKREIWVQQIRAGKDQKDQTWESFKKLFDQASEDPWGKNNKASCEALEIILNKFYQQLRSADFKDHSDRERFRVDFEKVFKLARVLYGKLSGDEAIKFYNIFFEKIWTNREF